MQKLNLTLLFAVSAASAFAGQLMPYETPIAVKAQIVRRTGIIREGEKDEFYFLKFSEPLDFRASRDATFADTDIARKNVRFVQLVGYGQGDLPSLDKLAASKKEFIVTGSFSGKDNWNQVGPVLFMPENGFDGYARCFKEAHN